MNDIELNAKIVITVLNELKHVCAQNEYCSQKCELYNREEATCFLRAYPCDYDIQEIEKRIIEKLKKEVTL